MSLLWTVGEARMWTAAVALAAALVLPVPGLADGEPSASALGRDGDFYRLRAGSYGELFPQGKAASAGSPVLALEARLQRGGKETLERHLVVGTEGPELETDLRLIYVAPTDSLYLVWQAAENTGDGALEPGDVRLVQLQDGELSDVVTVRSADAGEAGPVAVATTQDDAFAPGPKGPVRVERTGIHFVWWQAAAAADGSDSAVYAPVIFLDGVYRGEHPTLALADLHVGKPFGGGDAPALERSPTVATGIDSKSVVLGFVDPTTGLLVSLEARMIPGELGLVADAAESYVLDWDAGLGIGGIENLAGGIRSHLIDIGVALHPGLRSYFAEAAAAEVVDLAWSSSSPGSTMESLAGGIRSHLIDIGVEAFGSDGMQRVFLPSRLSVVEVGRAKSAGDLVRLYVVADRPAPEVGPDAVTLFLSLSGEESLVSWEVEGRLHYRESLGGGWSEVHTLAPGLDGEEAKRVLRDRLRPH